jgi:gamma-glutamylaminecyclotransferase
VTLLFVYGTLKRGHRADRLLAGQRFVAAAATEPRYRLYDLGSFPGLVEVPDGVAVVGEVWAVGECCLEELDDYEGAPDLFARRPIAVAGVGEPVEAYFYAGRVPADAPTGDRWPFG